jgi:hypothetical protein
MKSTLIAVAVAGLLASGAALANDGFDRGAAYPQHGAVQQYDRHYDRWQDRSSTIDQREARIDARIRRGLDDGRITRREARHLYRELHEIEAKERAFEADGRLNRREMAELGADLDQLAERVRQQMRDDQRRW